MTKHKSKPKTQASPKNYSKANRTGSSRNVLKMLSWNIESRS